MTIIDGTKFCPKHAYILGQLSPWEKLVHLKSATLKTSQQLKYSLLFTVQWDDKQHGSVVNSQQCNGWLLPLPERGTLHPQQIRKKQPWFSLDFFFPLDYILISAPKPSSHKNVLLPPPRRSTPTTRCAAAPGSTPASTPNRCCAVTRENTSTASPSERRGNDTLKSAYGTFYPSA